MTQQGCDQGGDVWVITHTHQLTMGVTIVSGDPTCPTCSDGYIIASAYGGIVSCNYKIKKDLAIKLNQSILIVGNISAVWIGFIYIVEIDQKIGQPL